MMSKMSRFFGYLIAFLLPVVVLQGQTINTIKTIPRDKGSNLRQACDNRAGTVTIGAIQGQSNTSGGETIYLCFGDSIRITHNGDFTINDPNFATPSGIVYLVTTCAPSAEITGPTVADIQKQPCLFPDDTLRNGNSVFIKGDYWTVSGQRNGNFTFRNLGLYINAFGKGKPVALYFTPITLDDFAGGNNEGGGQCVNLNPDAAFRIAFLKPIDTARVRTRVNNAGCTGSFIVGGGVPEFDPNERYTISIVKENDPNVKGVARASSTNNNTASHLDSVAFFVPEPGRYIVTITDGRNCNMSFPVNMAGCQAVKFQFPYLNAKTGDEICVNLTTSNFNKVGLFEMNIRFDTTVLEFVRTQNYNPNLGGLGSGSIGQTSDKAGLAISWSDNSLQGVTLPDSATIVTFCFRVIGPLGSSSPLELGESRSPSETVGTSDPFSLGYIFRDGQVNVTNDVLFTSVRTSGLNCKGDTDGVIEVIADKGQAEYLLRLSRIAPLPSQNFADETILTPGGNFRFEDLQAGTYTILIRDRAGNEKRDTIIFPAPDDFAVRLEGAKDLSCHDSRDGSLQAVIVINAIPLSNPDSTYKFQWNIPGERTATVDSLRAGNYSVTVTNGKGCTSFSSTPLTAPTEIRPTATITQNSCSGIANGSIQLSVAGGLPYSGGRYFFQWPNQAGDTATTSTISNLIQGNYTVTVTDSKQCVKQFSFPIEPLVRLEIDTVANNVSCFGLANGEIIVAGVKIGATQQQPFIFTWSGTSVTPVNMPTNSTISNIPAGTYIVTMDDQDIPGCRISDTIVVTEPQPLSVTQGRLQNETCNPGNDGLASINVSGGIKPYAYEWRRDTTLLTAQTDSLATGLSSGRYFITVIDSNQCDTIFDLTVNAPAGPQITQLNDFTLRCFGDANGQLSVRATPQPGTQITSYNWDNQATGANISNLPAGRYIVVVTASDFCSTVDTAEVIAPAPINIDSITAVMPRCPGDANGSLTVNVSGGTAPFKFLWKDEGTDTSRFQLRPALAAGNYEVTVFDDKGCPSVSSAVTLQDPPRILINFTDSTGVACFEGSTDGRATATAQFSNGQPGLFEFTWESGETFAGVASSSATMLSAGMAVLVVVDSNACAAADSVLITSPPEIKIVAVVEAVTCFGLADGKVKLTPGGGTPPFSITWSGLGSTQDSLSNLQAGMYQAIITDSRNCIKNQDIEIKEPAELRLEVDQSFSRASSCSNTDDGRFGVVVNTDEGINPLPENAFTWSGDISRPNSPFAENLAPGTYSVTVTDTKNCTDSVSYTVISPPPVIAILNPVVEPRCFGDATTLTVDTAYGGNGVDLSDFSFSVDNNGINFPLNQAANIFAGAHVIIVEDQLGCQYIDSITVNQPERITVDFNPNQVTVELGDSLQLTPIIVSSKPITTYVWSPSRGLSATNIESPYVITATRTERDMRDDTDFILTVTDTSGCKAEGTIFVELDRNRNFYVPNAFTPNGDGRNDEFRVFGCKGVKAINYARLFDRWGNLIMEANDITPDCAGGTIVWDGLLTNRKANQGVYVYIIEVEFLDDVKLLYRGDVGLIR